MIPLLVALLLAAQVYECRAPLVIDGDTIDCGVIPLQVGIQPQLGFLNARFRFEDVNAPEVKTPEGKAARQALIDKLAAPPSIQVLTRWSREKFGRFLGTFFLGTVNLSQWMVEQGHAKPCRGPQC